MSCNMGNDVKAVSTPMYGGKAKPKKKKPKTKHGFGPHGPKKIFGAK